MKPEKRKNKNHIQETENFSWNSTGKKGRENPSIAAAKGFVVVIDDDDYGGLLFVFFFIVVFNLLVFDFMILAMNLWGRTRKTNGVSTWDFGEEGFLAMGLCSNIHLITVWSFHPIISTMILSNFLQISMGNLSKLLKLVWVSIGFFFLKIKSQLVSVSMGSKEVDLSVNLKFQVL